MENASEAIALVMFNSHLMSHSQAAAAAIQSQKLLPIPRPEIKQDVSEEDWNSFVAEWEPGGTTAAPAEDEPAAVQGADPAVMFVDKEALDKILEKLPFPPLSATLKKWRERQASPAMKDYIQKIREQKIHIGENNVRVYLPYNLRDKLIAMRGKRLAEGPYINRKMLIDEYKLKQQWKQWNLLA